MAGKISKVHREWWEIMEWHDPDMVAKAHRHGHPERAHMGFGAYLPFHSAFQILTEQFEMPEDRACDFLFPRMEELPLVGDGEVS
mgnify:CR=1 FL=1